MAGQRASGRSRTAATKKAASRRKPNGNVAKVAGLLEALRREQPLDARDEALGQVALTLARCLDDGAGMATAAVSKELRATLADLMKDRDGGDNDDGWTAGLSSAVRQSEES